MNVDRALELAVMAAEDDSPWSESLKVLAAEVTRLRAAAIPKDTRKGEHPDDGQQVLVWIDIMNVWCVQEWWSNSRLGQVGNLWLPAPPSPEEP